MGDLAGRAKAAAALGHYVGTAAGRDVMRKNGYNPAMQIVIALPDDKIRDVISRITAYRPPVVLAVWLEGKSGFSFITVAPGKERAAGPPDQFSGESTIGMLIELLDREAGQLRFKLTDWARYEARPFEPTLALA